MLDLLEKDNPDLVAAYRAKMTGTDQAVQDARDAQDYGSIANTIGSAATDYSNGMKSDVVLHNRMDKLGSAPKIIEPEKSKWDPSAINTATSQGLARATGDRDLKAAEFAQETKLQDLGMARSDAALKRGDEATVRARDVEDNDPTSARSQAARESLLVTAPSARNIAGFENLSAAQVSKVAPQLMERYKLDELSAGRREAAARSAENTAVQRDLVAATRDNARQERAGKRMDAGVQKLGEKAAPIQELRRAVAGVEGALGFSLDEYDPKTNSNKKGVVDLPGVNVPGMGRVSAYDAGARDITNSASKVFNITLADRSGAAVTTDEMERLKREFAAGKYDTEAALLKALKEFKAEVAVKQAELDRSFPPDIVEEYQGRAPAPAAPVTRSKPGWAK